MADVNIGIKIFYPYQFEKCVRPHLDKIDFIEIMGILGNDYSFLKDVDKPVVVHNMHNSQGFDLCDPKKRGFNKKCLEYSLHLAEELDARNIIVHPGQSKHHYNEEGFPDEKEEILMIDTLLEAKESSPKGESILVENLMVFCNNYFMTNYGYHPTAIRRICEPSKLGFCFDIGHAVVGALQFELSYMDVLQQYADLGPGHFHVSDMLTAIPKDQHLHLGKGNLPYSRIKDLLPEDAFVTIETHTADPMYSVDKDIEFLRKL